MSTNVKTEIQLYQYSLFQEDYNDIDLLDVKQGIIYSLEDAPMTTFESLREEQKKEESLAFRADHLYDGSTLDDPITLFVKESVNDSEPQVYFEDLIYTPIMDSWLKHSVANISLKDLTVSQMIQLCRKHSISGYSKYKSKSKLKAFLSRKFKSMR